ncbi:MAG: pirin family protein [Candidatus Eremiobacteraeota bacterium]|nr:pirin family protein [Candidatus Eremiobacteraeota bacterium]
MFAIQRADERYCADHGWLKTCHSFSFAEYYDPRNLNWGALRVLNDDTIAPSNGFPMHPHRDMEILTYVLSGALEHKDSMGNEGIVKAGGVQYMSAGTGVRHSESNPSNDTPLHLVQMWVLPGRKGTKPSYGQVDFTDKERHNKWLLVASGMGDGAPVALTQNASFRVARLDNGVLEYPFENGRLGFLFVADGSVAANGSRLDAGDALRTSGLPSLSLSGSGEVLLWDVPPTIEVPI